MKNYEQASEELSQFEEALKKAEVVGMKVEWFSAFKESVIAHSVSTDGVSPYTIEYCINAANKKLGM